MHMISRPTPQKLCMTSLLLALISRQTQVNNSNQTKYTKSGTKVKMEPNTCQEVKYYCRNRLQVVLHSSYDCHLHAVCLVYVEQGRRRRQERACAITIIVFWPSQSYNHSSRSYNIMYVLKAQQKKKVQGPGFHHHQCLHMEEETLDTWEVGISFFTTSYYIHYSQVHTKHTLIHQVIIGDVQKTDHIGPFWQGQLAPSNQENLRFFPAHFVQNMNILRTFFYSTG